MERRGAGKGGRNGAERVSPWGNGGDKGLCWRGVSVRVINPREGEVVVHVRQEPVLDG